MGFDLTKAMGLDRVVSGMDTTKVEQLPIDRIVPNERNFFDVSDVQDLKESIQVNGILQPLLVLEAGAKFRLVAGHRRLKAAQELGLERVPAVILPEMSESMEMFVLMKTNTTSRELSYWEKSEAAIRLNKHLVQLKKEGHEFHGRLRDIVAEQLEISRTEVARMEAIDKHLCEEGKELLKAGKLNPTAAYALSKAPEELQRTIIDERPAAFVSSRIEERTEKHGLDWLRGDCSYPLGWHEHNEKEQGRSLPCPGWLAVKKHKGKGHPESCCGCCAECASLANGYRCPDVCLNYKEHLNSERRKAASAEAEAARDERRTVLINRLFAADAHDVDAVVGELDESADFSTVEIVDLLVEYIEHMPVGSGWNPWPQCCPDDGQAVIVCRKALGMTSSGMYIYRNGEFWFEGDDDPEVDKPANLPGIYAWAPAPEEPLEKS